MTSETEPVTAAVDPPSPARRRSLRRRAMRVAWLVVLVAALAVALRSRWAEVGDQLAMLRPWLLVLAGALGLLGVGLSAGIWHAVLRGIGEEVSLPVSLRIFFVGQIGKYVPGAVWPAVTQAALAREHGIAPRATVTAVTLFLWVHLVTGAVLGITLLSAHGDLPLWGLAILPLLLVLLAPRVVRWALRGLLRMARREPLRRLPDRAHMMAAGAWAVLMWLCYGAHLVALTGAVSEPIGVVRAIGVFAAAWVVGFVLLIAPAGVGPREAALVALLPLSAAAALLVALVSRLVLTAADAAWAGLTAVDPSRSRRSRR